MDYGCIKEKEKQKNRIMIAQIKKDWLILFIIALPFLALVFLWNDFPETVAIHFDAAGNPNGYAGKAMGLLGVPAINLGIYFLMIILPRIDPAKKNYVLFEDKLWIIRLAIHALLTFIACLLFSYALGYAFNMGKFIFYPVLLVLLILGNYMGNIRTNYFVGIRTPWTLANETVWRRTHRFTAKLWVISCILMMSLLPFLENPSVPFIIFTLVIALVPMVYSYFAFRQVEREVKQ